MSTVTTYFWVIHYQRKAPAAASTAPAPTPAAQPAGYTPQFVSVVHRNIYSTYSTEYGMPRGGLPTEARYYKGAQESRIEARDFHPTEQDAINWINANWTKLQADSAIYAEMHTFTLTFKDLAGSTGPI